MRSGLILLGGMATRAENRAKYLFTYTGETFFHHQIQVLKKVTDEIIISVRDPDQIKTIPHYSEYTIVTDVRKGMGPSEGIRTGVEISKGDLIFVVACDMPFLSAEIIDYLFNHVGSADAIVPGWKSGYVEPLHAVYRREALVNFFKKYSSQRLWDITSTLNSTIIPVEELKKIDPMLQTFTNINDLNTLQILNGKIE